MQKATDNVMEKLEGRIADLEKQVQSQQEDMKKAIGAFENMGLKWENVRIPISQKQF